MNNEIAMVKYWIHFNLIYQQGKKVNNTDHVIWDV